MILGACSARIMLSSCRLRLFFLCSNAHPCWIARHGECPVAYLSTSPSLEAKEGTLSSGQSNSKRQDSAIDVSSKERINLHIIRVFIKGCYAFAKDCRKSISILIADKGSSGCQMDRSHLPRSDLRTLRRVHLTVRQCGVLVAVACLPIVGYLSLGALLFSRHLLTSYFWTVEQQVLFAAMDYRERRSFYNPFLASLLAAKTRNWDTKSHDLLEKLVAGHPVELDNFHHGLMEQVSLNTLTKEQLYLLSRCWQVWRVFPNMRRLMPKSMIRWQLRRRIHIVREDDLAIVRDFKTLSEDDIIEACQFRGMKTQGVQKRSHEHCLKDFCQVSAQLRDLSATAMAGVLVPMQLEMVESRLKESQ